MQEALAGRFVGPDFVATVRHAEAPDLGKVRRRLEAAPELLARGPEAVLYAIVDEVVDEYAPVIAGLENDIDEIEDQLFGGPGEEVERVSRRIYDLAREVIDFQRATQPLVGMLEALLRGSEKYEVDLELQRHLRDVLDHALRIVERTASFRSILENALSVQATLVAQRQNDEMRRMSELGLSQNDEMRRLTELSLSQNDEIKKISSWAAILFAPTLVGTVYGMNFDHMPELHWAFGYPFAMLLMLGLGFVLHRIFKFKHWL